MSDYTTPAELADRLKVGVDFVRAQAKSRTWPHSKVGNRVRFSPEDVEAIQDLIKVGQPKRRANRKALHANLARINT